ncbi:MAG: SDR family NAD(P)-dependent oxidoreductase, partial [Planctomycetota bacterium]
AGRYLGGYVMAKHALTGWTRQLRQELADDHIHVGLVCPGPIARSDAGTRYEELLDDDLPESVSKPGAGTKLKGLAPQRVADAVVDCIARRKSEVILPRRVRLLIVLAAISPALGDWLVKRFSSSK